MKQFLPPFWVLLILSSGVAAQPLDPLVFSVHQPGRSSYGMELSLVPAGQAGLGYDTAMEPYTYTRAGADAVVTLTASRDLTHRLGVTATWSPSWRVWREQRTYPYSNRSELVTGPATQASTGSLALHIYPAAVEHWQSQLDIGYVYPEIWTLVLSGFVVRDPLVSGGWLAYQDAGTYKWTTLGARAGFVVNDKVTLSAAASLTLALAAPALPAATTIFQWKYDLDTDRAFSLASHIGIEGGQAKQSFAVGYSIQR